MPIDRHKTKLATDEDKRIERNEFLTQLSFKQSFFSSVAYFLALQLRFSLWKTACSIFLHNSYFYIEKWTFKIMCEVCYRAKRDKKEAT